MVLATTVPATFFGPATVTARGWGSCLDADFAVGVAAERLGFEFGGEETADEGVKGRAGFFRFYERSDYGGRWKRGGVREEGVVEGSAKGSYFGGGEGGEGSGIFR